MTATVDRSLLRRKEIVRLLQSMNGSHVTLSVREIATVVDEPLDVVKRDLNFLANRGEVVQVQGYRLTQTGRDRA